MIGRVAEFNAARFQLFDIHLAECNFNRTDLIDKNNGAERDADNDGLGQIERGSRQHRDQKRHNRAFETMSKHPTNFAPLVHANCRHHQHARQSRHRNLTDETREQKCGGEQKRRVKNAREPRQAAAGDADAGTRNRRCCRHAAKKWNHDIAQSLRNQFLIVVHFFAGHIARDRAAQ
ncbi:MAG: hypothetical protein HDKAJFGB_01504 [Anaerolineae bacterium]|nr:hypothetical protein [Anaerolineae bacterium]